jgi:hypothetical protein
MISLTETKHNKNSLCDYLFHTNAGTSFNEWQLFAVISPFYLYSSMFFSNKTIFGVGYRFQIQDSALQIKHFNVKLVRILVFLINFNNKLLGQDFFRVEKKISYELE